jgi:imidazolonepropionase
MAAQFPEPVLIHNANIFRAPANVAAPGAIYLRDGQVSAIGQCSAILSDADAAVRRIDAGGRLVTSGLIDCHTHLVFAGNRSSEFAMRLQGMPYEAIARAGGGIMSTVRATRAETEESLLEQSLPRLDALIAEGVTHVEIKSGYGLSIEAERRTLRVARRMGVVRPVHVTTTFLGAHALPPEFFGKDAYIDHIVTQMLPTLTKEGLVDAVDGFCEGMAFSNAQIEKLFRAARDLGLPVKLHAEQLSFQGGAALAARYGALSADHLEWLDETGVAAMAAAGTVAVLLPGAYYCMRETRKPPVAALRRAGVPIAVATDLNPGTSPVSSPFAAMHLACVLFGLSSEEALDGMTENAARALGLPASGQVKVGTEASLVIWNAKTTDELVLQLGGQKVHKRVWRGTVQ